MVRGWSAAVSLLWAAGAIAMATQAEPGLDQDPARSGIEIHDDAAGVRESFSPSQLAVLEKLNRADLDHLARLPALVVPRTWADELEYSVLPQWYPSAEAWPTLLVVYVPGQLFGAYVHGRLVRWGPVSTGARATPTLAGTFSLNWRSMERASTVDPTWLLRWYFNFDNVEGLAFHAYALPGHPASHGCVRLLERDAAWLFEWGHAWHLGPSGTHVVAGGTPVLILGTYDFEAAPPWQSVAWWASEVVLPAAPPTP